MKGKVLAVSYDFPTEYLSKHTLKLPKRGKQFSCKSLKPQLNYGVSKEAPEHFHNKATIVLDTKAKNQVVAGKHYSPGAFNSELKKYRYLEPQKFEYLDSSHTQNKMITDLDSVKVLQGIDLSTKEQRKFRGKISFYKHWDQQKDSQKGFKKCHSIITYQSNLKSPERFSKRQIEILHSKTLNSRGFSTTKSRPVTSESKRRTASTFRPKTTSQAFLRTPCKNTQSKALNEEINQFEEKLKTLPRNNRWVYDFQQGVPNVII